jgi:hypothetical protein
MSEGNHFLAQRKNQNDEREFIANAKNAAAR